ncbi:MAG: hypothetical protein ACI94O_002489, partial [Octadecabacter sp.]
DQPSRKTGSLTVIHIIKKFWIVIIWYLKRFIVY